MRGRAWRDDNYLSSEPDSPQFECASAGSVTKDRMAEMRSLNGLILQNLIETMTSGKYIVV